MAAHDDEISTNRRRLFKALSVAPVVTTLSPGSSLANASAFQCANKPMGVPERNFYTDPAGYQCPTENTDGCHVYLERDFWDADDDVVSDCTEWDGMIVVETSPNVLFAIAKSDTNGSTRLQLIAGTHFSRNGDVLTLLKASDQSDCVVIPESQVGWFLLIGHPTFGADGDPDNWVEDGVFPEYLPTDPGETDRMGGSCLNSFGNGDTRYKLANG